MRSTSLESFLPTSTRSFTRDGILDSLTSTSGSPPVRLDGREQLQFRDYAVDLKRGDGTAMCTLTLGDVDLGATVCVTTVTGSLCQPGRAAPSRGFLNTDVSFVVPPPQKSASLFTSPARISALLSRLLGTNASSARWQWESIIFEL